MCENIRVPPPPLVETPCGGGVGEELRYFHTNIWLGTFILGSDFGFKTLKFNIFWGYEEIVAYFFFFFFFFWGGGGGHYIFGLFFFWGGGSFLYIFLRQVIFLGSKISNIYLKVPDVLLNINR